MPSSTNPRVRHAEDLELVRRVLEGDPVAVETFVNRMLCARRFLIFKNASFGGPLGAHEVEDTVQSTLLAVWRKLREFEGRGSLESWVYRFSYLELMNRLQAQRRRPAELDERNEPGAESERRPDPLECERLYRGLERLEPESADIIRLKHLESRTFDEIGTALAIPVNTAKTRYYRGMRRLRQLLRDPRTAEGGRPA